MEDTMIEVLASYACGLAFEDLPKAVVRKANDCFFDLIGCYYGALKKGKNQAVLKAIAGFNPMPEARMWGTGLRCGVAEAALGIGTLCYDLEYDDGISVSGHWGSASIPAAYLSVQSAGGDGRRFLTALVAAYETGSRISRVFSPELLKKHVHFPCTMGAFGAAAGFARGAGCKKDILAGALSLAGLFPVGTYSTATSGAAGKGLYSGWPNFLGIQAVRLAGTGLSGDRDILENPDGFGRAVGLGAVEEAAKKAALQGLGETYQFMEVYFKPYPCCRWLHAPIHGMLELMKNCGLRREEVERVVVRCPEFALMYRANTGFDSKVRCQYSIPYSVGAAIWFGQVTPEEFEAPARSNREFLDFVRRITMEYDEELQRGFPGEYAVGMEVYTKSGQVLSIRQKMPWGPDAPASEEELIRKFSMLAEGILSTAEIDEWVQIYRSGVESDGAMERIASLLGTDKL